MSVEPLDKGPNPVPSLSYAEKHVLDRPTSEKKQEPTLSINDKTGQIWKIVSELGVRKPQRFTLLHCTCQIRILDDSLLFGKGQALPFQGHPWAVH